MSDYPRAVLALSNLLMLGLMAVPIMLSLARLDAGHSLVLLPTASAVEHLVAADGSRDWLRG